MKKKKSDNTTSSANPDHSPLLSKLNRAEGQINGIKRMINENRYCPDIIQQVRATRKALLSIEASLVETHIHHCVRTTLESNNPKDKKKKLDELMTLFKSAGSQGIDL